jgi:hypothetical protein
MTPNELTMIQKMYADHLVTLKEWQQERHDETMDRLDRIESRFDTRLAALEDAPRLTPAQVARLERTASRFENAAKWFSPKRLALLGSLPGSGGALYLVNWLHNVFR